MKVRNKDTGKVFEVPDGTPPTEFYRFDTTMGRPKRPRSTDEQDIRDAERLAQAAKRPPASTFTERVKERGQKGSLMPFSTEALSGGLSYIPGVGRIHEGLAKAIVPQTPRQYGIALGTLAAGPFGRGAALGLGRLGKTAIQLGAPTAAGAGAGALEGRPYAGAAEGLTAGVLGKIGAKVPEWTSRAVGQKIHRLDATRLGGALKNLVDSWRGYPVDTLNDLADLVKRDGQNVLTRDFQRTMFSIIEPNVPFPLRVSAVNRFLGFPPNMPLPFHEVVDQITRMGKSAWTIGGDPKSGLSAFDLRLLREKAVEELTQELRQVPRFGTALSGAYSQGMREYMKGARLLDLMNEKGVWQGGKLNMAKLQDVFDTKEYQEGIAAVLNPAERMLLNVGVYRVPLRTLGRDVPAQPINRMGLSFAPTGRPHFWQHIPTHPPRYTGEQPWLPRRYATGELPTEPGALLGLGAIERFRGPGLTRRSSEASDYTPEERRKIEESMRRVPALLNPEQP